MNRILKLLVFSDIFVITGFGLIAPIMAIFIKDNLIGGSIFAAGLASTIFIATRCILQLLFSYYGKPEYRFKMLIAGTFLISLIPFMYSYSTRIEHIYIAQFIYGFAAGLANPAWFSLFASNLSKGQQGFEWSIYSSSVGFGAAAAAYLGSILASRIGFKPVFFIVGFLSLAGCFILIFLFKKDENKKRKIPKRTNKTIIPKLKPYHH